MPLRTWESGTEIHTATSICRNFTDGRDPQTVGSKRAFNGKASDVMIVIRRFVDLASRRSTQTLSYGIAVRRKGNAKLQTVSITNSFRSECDRD